MLRADRNRRFETGAHVRDISEVIRKKQDQQAQLAQQIEALQGAVKELDAVRHLLEDAEPAVASS